MWIGLSSHAYPWAVGAPGRPTPQPPFTAQDLLAEARRLGARVVQFGSNLQLDTFTLGEIDSLAVAVASSSIEPHLGSPRIEGPTLRFYLELAQQLNARLVCARLPAFGAPEGTGEIGGIVRSIADQLPRYESAGIVLALENSDTHPAAVYGEILRRLPSRNLAMCLDTAVSLGRGESVNDLVAACGGRIACVQVRDVRIEKDTSGMQFRVEGCPAGEGVVDLPAVLQRLAVAGVSLATLPLIVTQWTPSQVDTMETVALERAWAQTSVEWVRRVATSATSR